MTLEARPLDPRQFPQDAVRLIARKTHGKDEPELSEAGGRFRERLIAENGGLVYFTYFDVARRYLFRRYDVLPHPLGRVPPTPGREVPRAA